MGKTSEKLLPARRWAVERTVSWLSKYRALLARYQEKAANYLGLLQFACVLIWFKQYYRLTNIYASPGSTFLDILQDRNEAYASE